LKISPNDLCPCGSTKKYKKCCKPFHDGQIPKSAEELMKSRFSAYALSKADYIMETTHPLNPDFAENSQSWKKDIMNFCDYTDFVNLEVYETQEGEDESFVTFKAILTQDNLDASFSEKSRFLKVNGKWFYIDGTFFDY